MKLKISLIREKAIGILQDAIEEPEFYPSLTGQYLKELDDAIVRKDEETLLSLLNEIGIDNCYVEVDTDD